MAEWRDAQLSELIDIKHGFAFKGEFFTDEPTGDILVTPGNFAIGGGFQLNKPKFYNGPVPKEYVLNPGDVIVTMTDLSKQADTLGFSAIVPVIKPRLLHNQRIGRVIAKDASANLGFIAWLMRTRPYRHEIVGGATGSTVKHTSPGRILAHRFKLPSPKEQQDIVDVLQPLDDKIELNRRMNETLEGMAQAIFRDWFVDFGPVRRALAGATDPAAIMGGLTPDPARAAHLAALFPVAFGNDGLPVGWSERPLDSIAEFLNGLALQKHPAKPGEPDLPVIKIAELRNGLSERSNRAARTLPAKYIIKDGDFIFSWSGSLMAKVWTEGEGALNQHLFKVSSDVYPQWFYGLWVHHHMPEFQLIAASKATTMGHIQRMHLTNAATVCPPEPTIEAMSAVMQPLWDRMIHNELENRTLAETRDYLLPRLMSGAVRAAPQAEAA
ncbi:type I restriction enzyme S subunit [Sphingobium sp. OAS761]|uniref:restriction endonuclease subunit S n=1 Tax=Sphingobium sp. OAS761 TaxID=2817901 RepID=UPI00209FF247|nr:type I restriction enzyme S subunit [Sphingobium sp. OAS761]